MSSWVNINSNHGSRRAGLIHTDFSQEIAEVTERELQTAESAEYAEILTAENAQNTETDFLTADFADIPDGDFSQEVAEVTETEL